MTRRLTIHRWGWRLAAVSLAVMAAWMLQPALAQYIDPSGLPPGGRSASYLDTSATTQQKLGSLLIGNNLGNGELCINGTGDVECIQDWAELGSGLSGNFLRLHPDPAAPPNDPSGYAGFIELGSAHVQGNGTAPAPTITADTFAPDGTNPGNLGTYTGIYATDSQDRSNYAARFAGRLRIVAHDNAAGPGQLCLNGTGVYNPNAPAPRYGCIDDWLDLNIPAQPVYIKLQFVNPPVYQLGSGWIGTGPGVLRGAFQVESAIVGGVSATVPGTMFSNDGLCNPEIGESGGADCI